MTLGRRPFRRIIGALVPLFLAMTREARAYIGAAYTAVVRECTRLPLRLVVAAAIGAGCIVAPISPSSQMAMTAEMPKETHAPTAMASLYQRTVAFEIETEQADFVPARPAGSKQEPPRRTLQPRVALPPKDNAPLWLEWIHVNEARHKARVTTRIAIEAP
jgi:hypothetical protein